MKLRKRGSRILFLCLALLRLKVKTLSKSSQRGENPTRYTPKFCPILKKFLEPPMTKHTLRMKDVLYARPKVYDAWKKSKVNSVIWVGRWVLYVIFLLIHFKVYKSSYWTINIFIYFNWILLNIVFETMFNTSKYV